jgi:DNA invertase Pin-like site-specific DNA recombinase
MVVAVKIEQIESKVDQAIRVLFCKLPAQRLEVGQFGPAKHRRFAVDDHIMGREPFRCARDLPELFRPVVAIPRIDGAAGCAKVFKEKVSGAKTDRAELAKALRRLQPGDVLVVTRLDRLARSTRDLLNILATIAERGVGFRSLKDTWADTTTPHGRLMLTVLGGLAEFERELIRARTGEGRKRAKDRGVKFGRPAALTPHQRQEALQRLANGNAQVDIARAFNVSQATISRLASL